VGKIACVYAKRGTGEGLDPPTIMTNLASGIEARWVKERLYDIDPIAIRSCSSAVSFCWGLGYIPRRDTPTKLVRFYRDLTDSGVRSMLVVPFPRVARGSLGIGVMGNNMEPRDFERAIAGKRSLLLLAAIYADSRMLSLREEKHMPFPKLAPREKECLEWLASGLSGDQIAHRMKVTVHTVQAHLASVKRKLGAKSREQALAIALRHDLIAP
jgi:LuxR family transcriptional regulator, quorum-sensing system regulator BjaR1